MATNQFSRRRFLGRTAAGAGLILGGGRILTACGDDATTAAPTTTTTKALTQQEILEAAAANAPLLQPNSDRRRIQVLSVADGSITSLANAVDGDRPVLLWFWAPH